MFTQHKQPEKQLQGIGFVALALLFVPIVFSATFWSGCDIFSASLTPEASIGELAADPTVSIPPRIIVPPTGEMRPAPPYAVSRSGVGPFLFGMKVQQLLSRLPGDPRVETVRFDPWLDNNIVRAESDGLQFIVDGALQDIGIVRKDIAVPTSGVGIGSTVPVAMLDATGDYFFVDHRVTYSPPSSSTEPGVTYLTTDSQKNMAVNSKRNNRSSYRLPEVVAIVVRPPPDVSSKNTSLGKKSCRRNTTSDDNRLYVPKNFTSCDSQFTMAISDSKKSLHVFLSKEQAQSAHSDKPQKPVWTRKYPAIVSAGFVDMHADRKQELVVVSKKNVSTPKAITTWHVEIWRLQRLVKPTRLFSQDVISLRGSDLPWLGEDHANIDFLLDIRAEKRSLTIGGFYLHRRNGTLRTVLPLKPKRVRISQRDWHSE